MIAFFFWSKWPIKRRFNPHGMRHTISLAEKETHADRNYPCSFWTLLNKVSVTIIRLLDTLFIFL